jgi:hypothetical protein
LGARRARDHADAGTLRIDVAGSGLHLSKAQRGAVARRVLLALSRFGRITKVTVRLAEQVNPLGGLDRRCRMTACLQSGDGVRAETLSGPSDDAVGRAVTRLAERVALSLDTESPRRVDAPRPAVGRGRPRRAR